MKLEVLRGLNAARQSRRAAILVTDPASGDARLVTEAEGYADDPLHDVLAERFRSGASGVVEVGGRSLFLTVELPPPRLVMIGAVHISQALAPMATIAGFDAAIIDPRTAFATAERFPGVTLFAEWPVDAIPRIGFDAFTAVAALTHDPKIDDDALLAALDAGCFYIGALGSRKTHGRRIERLGAAGASPAALAGIRAPIGLPIRARAPAEIAVAILAEVIAALRSRGAAGQEAAA